MPVKPHSTSVLKVKHLQLIASWPFRSQEIDPQLSRTNEAFPCKQPNETTKLHPRLTCYHYMQWYTTRVSWPGSRLLPNLCSCTYGMWLKLRRSMWTRVCTFIFLSQTTHGMLGSPMATFLYSCPKRILSKCCHPLRPALWTERLLPVHVPPIRD